MWPPRFHDKKTPKSTLPEDATIQVSAFWLNCFWEDIKDFSIYVPLKKFDPHCGPHSTSGKMIWKNLNLKYMRVLSNKFSGRFVFWEFVFKDFLNFFPCENSSSPYGPEDHGLNTLESTLAKGACTQVSAFLAKWFLRRFVKDTIKN